MTLPISPTTVNRYLPISRSIRLEGNIFSIRLPITMNTYRTVTALCGFAACYSFDSENAKGNISEKGCTLYSFVFLAAITRKSSLHHSAMN